MTFVDQVANSNGGSGSSRPPQDKQHEDSRSHLLGNGYEVLARGRRFTLLNRVVEAEILPRLALVRAATKRDPGESSPDLVTSEDDTTELVRLLMGSQDDSAWAFIELLELRGATPASLYLGIVTQAARRLGELWEDDRCDFTEVTISLGRLQQVVRALSPSFQMAAVSRSAHADTILLLPAPGDQHTFGLVILGEFFQREGWHVVGGPASTEHNAVELVHDAWIDVVGFSVGSTKRLDELALCIRAVRKASRNTNLVIMVGGPLFVRRPDLVARVGADTTAPDAPGALRQAKSLLAMRAAAD